MYQAPDRDEVDVRIDDSGDTIPTQILEGLSVSPEVIIALLEE